MAVLIGTNGDDTINGTFRSDDISGKAGDDLLRGRGRADEIKGGLGEDTANGGLNNDLLRGGLGDDLLRGGLGEDFLRGGFGDDLLSSGRGSDVMHGGPGADTFVLRAYGPPAQLLAAGTEGDHPGDGEEEPHECPTDHPEHPDYPDHDDEDCPYPPEPEPNIPLGDLNVVLDFDWRSDAIAVDRDRIADIVVGDFDADGDFDATLILDTGDRTLFLNATESNVIDAII